MSPPPSDRGHDAPTHRSRVSTATTSRGTASAAALPWANGSFLADFRRDLNHDIATVTAAATGTGTAIAKENGTQGHDNQEQKQRLTDWLKANPAFLTGTANTQAGDQSFAPSVSATDASFNFNLTSFLLDDRPQQRDKRPTKPSLQPDSLLGTSNGEDDSKIDNVRGELQALAARGSALAAAIGASDSFDQSLSLSALFPVPPVPPALSATNTFRRTLEPTGLQSYHAENDDDDLVLPSRPGQQAVPQHAYIGGRGFTTAQDADAAAVMYANPASRFGRRPPLFPVPALDHAGLSLSTSSADQDPGSPTPVAPKSKSPANPRTSDEQYPPRLPSLQLDVQMGSTAALIDAVAAESSTSPPLTPRPQPQDTGARRGSQESTITGPPSSFLVAMQHQLRSETARRPSTPPPAQHAQVPPVASTPPPPVASLREAYVTDVPDGAEYGDDDDDDLSHAHLLPKYPTMPRVVSTPKSKSKPSTMQSSMTMAARPAAAAAATAALGSGSGSARTPAPVPSTAGAAAPIASPPSPSSPPTDPLYSHPPHELAHAVNQLTAQLRDVTAARDRLMDRVKAAEDEAGRLRAELAGAQSEVEGVRDELAGVRRHLRVVDEDRERKAELARMESGKVGELRTQVVSLQRMVKELGDTVKIQERRLREVDAEGRFARGGVLDPGPGSPPMPAVGGLAGRPVDAQSRSLTPVADMQTQTPASGVTPNVTTMAATQYRVLRETSVQTDRRARKDSASSAASSASEDRGNGERTGGAEPEDDDAKVRRARRKVLHAELQREMMRKLRAVAMRRLERERAAAAAAVGEAYELDHHHHHYHQEPVVRPRSAPVSPARVRVRGRSVDATAVRYQDRQSDPSPRRHTESSRRKVLSAAAPTAMSTSNLQASGPSASSGSNKPPFILGSNPGKSHSLPVNLQRMMSLAKNHAPGLCPHCHGDPHATSHRHPVATVVAHAIPAAENSRRKLEEQQHVLHVELARLVRQSDAARDLKAKKDMHPVIQRVIRRLAELDRELEEMGVGDGCEHNEQVGEQPSAGTRQTQQQQQVSRAASVRSSAASSPAVDRKKAVGTRASATREPLGQQLRAAERPQLRNLSLLRSSQKVQQALLMGT
ncbi:hypothetical protein BCR44DRAFT_1426187 [Catenaria anguillulae PL171]|uniref:Cep57 centrosome microtubule-binding domain-containing protein n=1 Tax=Catenaria anguillulae PL171 TaxID=765915 RepID=A0A1Y2I291_9FUNG|nr:hypothetical protein BCR44DRAFT_1426187 [Catenaria anguillulae PL171]